MFQLTIARQTGLQVASASSCGRKILHGEVEEILPGSVHKIWVPKADLQQPAHKHAHCVSHLSQKLEVWYGFAWYVQAMQPTHCQEQFGAAETLGLSGGSSAELRIGRGLSQCGAGGRRLCRPGR